MKKGDQLEFQCWTCFLSTYFLRPCKETGKNIRWSRGKLTSDCCWDWMMIKYTDNESIWNSDTGTFDCEWLYVLFWEYFLARNTLHHTISVWHYVKWSSRKSWYKSRTHLMKTNYVKTDLYFSESNQTSIV